MVVLIFLHLENVIMCHIPEKTLCVCRVVLFYKEVLM